MHTLTVHQSYPLGIARNGKRVWRIAFLCPTRGVVEIYRTIATHASESEQAVIVRETIAQFQQNN